MDADWPYVDDTLEEYLDQIVDEVDTLQSINNDYLSLDLDVVIDKRRNLC